MHERGTATFALLALLGVRPWSGYELTKQARRSLRYLWPSSEAHLGRVVRGGGVGHDGRPGLTDATRDRLKQIQRRGR